MTGRIYFFTAALLVAAAGIANIPRVEAAGGCIPGGYLAVEGSGTQSLWTFSSDGTFQASSSAQSAFNFSNIHGAWQREGRGDVRAVGLDFGFLPEPVGSGVPPQTITRIDVSLAFARDCQQFAGDFELRFYNAADDPLDAGASVPAGTDTVMARRIQVP
jgi:hypothetical protein